MSDETSKYIARRLSELDAEQDRLDRQRRGDPLTPEEEARIRAQERRWAMESRIRREEWAKAQGFPYYPMWLLPAFVIVIFIFAGIVGVSIGLHGR